MKSSNPHRGSDFREFLADEGQLEDVEVLAMKKAVALQMKRILTKQAMTKTQMAKRMNTSRAVTTRVRVRVDNRTMPALRWGSVLVVCVSPGPRV